jgi:heterodisulfide reductase subunit B
MGDAKRSDKRYGSSVGFGHSDKQEEYLRWKYKELENLCNETSLKKCSNYDKRYDKNHISWRFYTKANTEIETIISQFYKEDKQITKEILGNLTAFSLAVWHMDDGYIDKSNYILCTDSYSIKSCENIIEWFKEEWDIDAHIRNKGLSKEGKMKHRIVIKSTSVQKFIDLIRPHIIQSMRYKIGEKK